MGRSCDTCRYTDLPGSAYPCRGCRLIYVKSMYEPADGEGLDNPYWKYIEALAERQRQKGISKYGQGLESNPMEILERLTYLEEELIDGLFYIEHIKAYIEDREKVK